MAESTAKLRRKIDSASDLQAVVRAMKAQAAASIGQYATSVTALDRYTRTIELGLGACLRLDPSDTPWRGPPSPTQPPIRAVVFGSDQGLVGRFNDAVAECAGQGVAALGKDVQVWAVGERVRARLVESGIAIQGRFDVPASVQAISRLVSDVLIAVLDISPNLHRNAPLPQLHLFFNRPGAGSSYLPVGQQVLPLDETWGLRMVQCRWPTRLPPEVLGEPVQILRGLIQEYLFVSIFKASAGSLASENASRLAAMERADQNIDSLLGNLQVHAQRLRQTRIDEELADVVSGFRSLRPRQPVR